MLVCLVLSVFVVNVWALSLSITQPNKDTVWKADQEVDIFWKTEGSNDKALKTVDFDLYKGGRKTGSNPELLNNIAFGVTYNHGDTFWVVDPKLESGDDYFVRISSPDNPDFTIDSVFFKVNNGPVKKQSRNADEDDDLPGFDDSEGNGSRTMAPTLLGVLLVVAFPLLHQLL